MTDSMLVREYAKTRSPELLAELAGRHSTWLYSAALRMVGDADLAEDVTQAVFVVLVQKAGTLGEKPVNAWLFGVARFAAKHALREQSRRRKHERMAAMHTRATTESQGEETWKAVAPLLDELVGRLKKADRQAVLLRFYQSKSMAEVGTVLGVSEDAAKKRVAKAVKRLRELMGARGVTVGSDALSVVLITHANGSAPVGLAANCASPMAKHAANAMSIAKGVIRMMAITKIKVAAVALVVTALVPAAIALALQANQPTAPATQPQAATAADLPAGSLSGAADLYAQAAAAITIDSPAATTKVFPDYLPSSPEWRRIAADAYAADVRVRELAHKARAFDAVNWPDAKTDLAYYNSLRNLAIHLSDNAVYAESQGRHVEAVETMRDLLHLSKLLIQKSDHQFIPVLVGKGINALAVDQLDIIATTIHLTDKPGNANDVQVAVVRDLIAGLLDQIKAKDQLLAALGPEGSPAWNAINTSRAMETMNRVNADQTMAAMSLAAHLFKFENGRWPEIMEEMIPNDLPHTMIDPFGNGKQVIGYVLAKGALPDGSDRPLVYCRSNAQDGLYFHANKLDFGYYIDDGSDLPWSQKKHYGQFRDVTVWEPRPNYKGPPALPLPKLSDRMGAAIPLHRTAPANGNLD